MAYGRRTARRGSFRSRRRASARAPKVVVKRSVKVPLATRRSVAVLEKQVRRNSLAKYGAPQVQRQSFRSTVGGGESFELATNTPVAFCLEAICTGNEVYSTLTDGAGLMSVGALGAWVEQPFPPTLLNAANEKFDLQLNRNAKSLGVRSTYLYRGTSIDIQLFAKSVNGYLHCYEVTPRSIVTRATDQERILPYALPSFVHMGGGGDEVYDQSSQFFSIKKKFSRYFNTIPGNATNRLLQTNNLAHMRYFHRGKKVITGADVDGINLVRDQDIPKRHQTWLIFTFTDNNEPSANSGMRIQLQKTVHWADSEGSK